MVLVLVFGLVREQQVGRQTGWERELWRLGELSERAGRLLAPVTLAARCDEAALGTRGTDARDWAQGQWESTWDVAAEMVPVL